METNGTPEDAVPSLPHLEAVDNNDKMVIFVDHENFHFGLGDKSTSDGLDELKMIRKHYLKEGCILGIKVYMDFRKITRVNKHYFEAGFDIVSVPVFDHKSLADPMMICDILKTLYESPEVTTFIIISGDKDFAPVVRTIGGYREKKKLKIISPNYNEMLVKICNSYDYNFIKYDDLKDYLDDSIT